MNGPASRRRGLLLINLGTPDSPTPEKVRDYLAEFLMDRYVIDIPAPLRWLLVHGSILRKRPQQSAVAYQKVWTERGSPLLFHLEDLQAGVRRELDRSEKGEDSWVVAAGMRYGDPSIESAILELEGQDVSEVLVLPLYPQYSLAATESSIVETRKIAARAAPEMRLRFLPPFYDNPGFIEAFAEIAQDELQGFEYDHLLFSFHGLPERQVKRTDPTGAHCLADRSCCDRIVQANRDCYRAQCFATARALAARMGLAEDRYSVCFQSRLGRTPWIKPHTDVLYGELSARGVKRLAVMCPAFVADCLETLEEIRIRGREAFRASGGEELKLVSSLNSSEPWIKTVAAMAEAEVEKAEVDANA